MEEEDFNFYFDFEPYMNKSPFVVQRDTSLTRVFRLFRTMGLRHLPVVNDNHEVEGMVTRNDLAHVEEKLKERRYTNPNKNSFINLNDSMDLFK